MTFIAGYFAHPGGMQNGNVPGVWPAVSGRQCPAMSIQGPCTQTHLHTHTHTHTHSHLYFWAAINLKFSTCVCLCDYYIMAKTMSTADSANKRGGSGMATGWISVAQVVQEA